MSLIQEALEKVGKARLETVSLRHEPGTAPAEPKKIPIPKVLREERVHAPVFAAEEKLPASAAAPVREEEKQTLEFTFSRTTGLIIAALCFLGALALFQMFMFGSIQKSSPVLSPPAPKMETQAPAAVRPAVAAASRPASRPVMNPVRSFYDSKPMFKLSGITTSGGEPLALVNNQVVGIGDLLKENATVRDIQNGRVVLAYNGNDVILTM